MRPFRQLAQTFWQSATQVRFYLRAIAQPLSQTLRYYFFVRFLYALIVTLLFTLFSLPAINQLVSLAPSILASVYPDDLVITISHGQASSNQSEPYFVPLTRVQDAINRLNHVLGATSNAPITYLAVVDTSASVSDISHYHTLFLLTQTHLVYQHQDDSFQAYPLTSIPDTRITQEVIKSTLTSLVPRLHRLLPLLPLVVLLLLGLFVPLIRSLYIFGFSVCLLLLLKLFRQPFRLKTVFQINLYLDVLISLLFFLLPLISLPRLPLLYTMLIYALISISLHLKLAEINKLTPSKAVPSSGKEAPATTHQLV